MDKDMDEMIRKMLGKPSNVSHSASHTSSGAMGGNGSTDLNNDNLIREKLSSYFLQQMLETQKQKEQQDAATSSPGPSTSQSAAQNDSKDVKVDLSLPDVENLVKLLLQNVKVTNQDKSALEEEKAKRRALEREAEEMRQRIKAFELLSQPSEAAAVQKKLDAFENINFFQSGKMSGDSMQSTLSKYLEDLMLKDKLAQKKLLNDPKWFPGSSKASEHSNTNSGQDKDLFKEMLRTPVNPGMPQQAHNFMQQGQFHGGHQPPHFHGNAPPYQQNGAYPMGHGPYPWPGHGGAPGMYPQQPPHMMGYGAPGTHGNMWHGTPHPGFPGPVGPYPGPNQKQGMSPQQDSKKKQKQPQPQQQNPAKQKQQNQQQNPPKQKQQPQNQQQNQPKQKQQNQQQQQNQPKQKQQNQAPNNVPPTQVAGKKKKNAQNQEQNKNGAQSKLTVPVGSCVTLSPNSPPSNSSSSSATGQNGNAEDSSWLKLTQDEINKLKQSIQMMNAQGVTGGKKKKNKKKKKAGEGEGENGEDDDSGSSGEGEKSISMKERSGGMVKNQLGEGGAKKKTNAEQQKKKEEEGAEAQQVVAPGEGKKKKKKKNAGGDGSQANSDFSLYVGDRWPTLADIKDGRLKLDQPVKNILMVAKTPKGDVCSTPKIVQDMLVFNKLHPTAVLVFTSD